MDAAGHCTSFDRSETSPRCRAAEKLRQADDIGYWWHSPQAVAQTLDVPVSTFHYWLRERQRRRQHARAPVPLVDFFESPDGIRFLRRLLLAAHLVFGQANDCGLRSLGEFLQLSGLDEFIAPSYGAQQTLAETLEQLLIEFGQEEERRLAGLPVTVVQVVSDEAKALIAHAETHLGAHHSPDLFHVQQETSQATSVALAGQIQRAEKAVQQQQQQAAAARRGLSRDYHPVDLDTGRPLTAEEVTQRLSGHFDRLEQIAAEAGLSAQAFEKLAKARRVLKRMTATLVFFWTTLAARFATWGLTEELETWLREQLLPGLYLERVARKAGSAEERARLAALAATVLARARSPDGPWGRLDATTRADLEAKLNWCADLFQRSSSCVEGRNGQLSLKHHALHRLTARKLGALRVLHNYLVERDGQTAAERFFGAAPRNLMAWLEARFSDPPRTRPRQRA